MAMLSVLTATAPIFLIIGLGYALFRSGLLPQEGVRAFGAFVLMVALPALIFKSLSQRAFVEILNPAFLAAFAAGTLGTALVVFLAARYGLKRDLSGAAIMALGAAGANSGFVGYPIAALVVGPPAVVALALCMLVENLVTIPLLLAVAEAGRDPERGLRAAFATSLKALGQNPMILAIAAGALASVIGLRLPGALEKSVDMLAAASAPVALVSIGGALAQLRLSRRQDGIALVVFGKLALHPAAVFVALMLAPGLDSDLRRAMLIIAAAPMMTIYPLLGARFGQASQTAAALLVATILSFLTMSAVIALT